MSRLIVISNRLGDPSKPASGGLAVALNGALKELGGLWIGWSGDVVENASTEPTITDLGNIQLVGLDYTPEQHDGFYLGYSNSVLWPAFHHRIDLMESDEKAFEQYCEVNRLYADTVFKLLKPDDIIWIHDYHLIPLAHELRQRGVTNRIGYFLHIPFPPDQIVAAIPNSEWWMRAFFDYDLIGFQTEADVANFCHYAQRRLDEAGSATEPSDVLEAFGRSITVKAFPIGIDVDQFRSLLDHPDAKELRNRLQNKASGRAWITGVERLDYSKGLPERFKTFRELLRKYPENQGVSTLVQIAPPTRQEVEAYADIREELEKLSGAVNGEFATIDWTPIRYIHRNVTRARLSAIFAISKVGLVTPLRDGMNLVAKEYVAVQDEADPGVLVLSEFAGAAEQMTAALLVNPYNIEQTADTLQRALHMPLEDRRERHAELKRIVEEGDVVIWCRNFLESLQKV